MHLKSFGAHAAGLRLARMQASPRYVDGAFVNTRPVAQGLKKGTATPTLSEFLCGGQRRTPRAPLPSQSPLSTWAHTAETGLRATWLGHSTVLLELDGARVLTDPVWGDRASPVTFAGPKRFQPVPVPVSALPELDAVIVSHDHYDHLDYPTILELAKRSVPFFTSLGVGAHLEAWGIAPERIIELDWWEHATVSGTDLVISAAPSQHFSGRGLGGRNATLWSSFVVRGPHHSVFFSGDTGLTPDYSAIRAEFGAFDLVLLEVGAFHEAWGDIHLGPEHALDALALLGGGKFLPVHWGTFNLAIHAWDEPAETLVRLAPERSAELVMPLLGEPVEPARVGTVNPWWRSVAALESKPQDQAAALEEPATLPPLADGTNVQWPMD
ncbi:MAG TPA: MBL fold metallo-hydrolase [Polyangiaceae bacterium]|jgi:L-ascorbate metabolism protein UlaG (beta-lactamase superfamily)